MFRASIDSSIAHSLSAWGSSHHLITTIVSKSLPYATIAFGLLWLILDVHNRVQSFSSPEFVKRLLVDGVQILVLPMAVALGISEFFARNAHGSFPSHLSALMGAVASAIYLKNRQAGNGLFWLAVISGLSLVAAGRNNPKDILFGISLGVVVSVGINRLIQRFPRV